MRSSIRRAKNWSRLHPQGADMLLTAALSILALVSSSTSPKRPDRPASTSRRCPRRCSAWSSTLGPLAFRRRAPIAAVLTCAGGFVVSRTLLDAQEASVVGVGISIAIYSAAAYGRPPWRNWACGVAGVAVLAELWRELATLAPDDQTNMVVVETFALLFYAALIVAIRRRPAPGGGLSAAARSTGGS